MDTITLRQSLHPKLLSPLILMKICVVFIIKRETVELCTSFFYLTFSKALCVFYQMWTSVKMVHFPVMLKASVWIRKVPMIAHVYPDTPGTATQSV